MSCVQKLNNTINPHQQQHGYNLYVNVNATVTLSHTVDIFDSGQQTYLWNPNAIYYTHARTHTHIPTHTHGWTHQQQRVVFQLAVVDIYRCCAVFEYHLC